MKTDTERTRQILQRTAQLKQARQVRRQRITEVGCVAACLALVVCLGMWMPGWVGAPVAVSPASAGGTASMLGQGSAGGYLLVGLLSFLLGSCVTILLYRLRRRSEKKQQTGEHHEL